MLLLLMATFSNASCQRDSAGRYNENEYVTLNARKAFKRPLRPVNDVQQGTGYVFQSPIYQTGGQAERWAVSPNANTLTHVNMFVLIEEVLGYNDAGQKIIRTYVDLISCKIVTHPQNSWNFWNNQPGFESYGAWYYTRPMEFSIFKEVVGGPGEGGFMEVWTVKLN